MFVFEPENPDTAFLAAALDPRFRKLKFLPSEEVLKVQSTVQKMAIAIERQARGNESPSNIAEDRPATQTKGASFLIVLGSDDSSTSDEQQFQEVQREVLQYFGEHPLSKKENSLPWWRANASRHPTLAKLAKSFLGIPATSTPSERLFSAAGNIASKRRASLTSDHVDMLTFLNCNYNLLF